MSKSSSPTLYSLLSARKSFILEFKTRRQTACERYKFVAEFKENELRPGQMIMFYDRPAKSIGLGRISQIFEDDMLVLEFKRSKSTIISESITINRVISKTNVHGLLHPVIQDINIDLHPGMDL